MDTYVFVEFIPNIEPSTVFDDLETDLYGVESFEDLNATGSLTSSVFGAEGLLLSLGVGQLDGVFSVRLTMTSGSITLDPIARAHFDATRTVDAFPISSVLVPEPSSLTLLALGLAATLLRRSRVN